MTALQIINEAVDPKRIFWQMKPNQVIKLRLRRKSETGEWVVRVWVDGKYSEDNTYYTDDKQDAVSTMAAMMRQAQAQGCAVI